MEIDIRGSYFDNEVLGSNAAGLFGAARTAGADPEVIATALRNFEPLRHRAQLVAELDDVRWVDDSKATNLAAMMASIRMQQRPVRLIAGGRPKESDFSAAMPLLRDRVREVFLIGEAAEAMEGAWKGAVDCRRAGTLERAVQRPGMQPNRGKRCCWLRLAPAMTSLVHTGNGATIFSS